MESLLFPSYLIALLGPRWILPALGVHTYLIVQSAVLHGRIPLIGMRETLGFLAWSIAALFVISAWNRKRDLYTWLNLSIILLLLIGVRMSPQSMPGPLPPVLRTIWFELHVVLSFVAYALFCIAASYGILALSAEGQRAEKNQYRSILLGYALFSTAMIFGGIWAYYAWGTYWLWTPKELWTTIVWFFYSLYLHGRLVRGWNGPKVIWMGILGFGIVLFTYAGVGLLMKSSHEF